MRAKYRVDVTKTESGKWLGTLVEFPDRWPVVATTIPELHEWTRDKIAEYEDLDPAKVNLVLRFVL